MGWVQDNVFDPIGDAFDWAVDDVLGIEDQILPALGDAADFVVGGIEEIGEFVVDGLGDVADFVGDTVEGFLDDPIGTLITIAAIAYPPLMPYLPLINAAKVGIEGGDFGDMLTSAAVSIVGSQVGGFAGDVAGGYTKQFLGDQIASQTLNNYIAQSVGSAVAGGTTSIIMGGDFDEGALNGLISYNARLATQSIRSYIETGEVSNQLSEAIALGEEQTEAEGGEKGEYSAKLEELRALAKEYPTITKGLEGAVGALLTGKDVSAAAVRGALEYQLATGEFVGKVVDGLGLDPDAEYKAAYDAAKANGASEADAIDTAKAAAQEVTDHINLTTHAVSSALTAGLNGGNSGTAAYNIMLNAGTEAFEEVVGTFVDNIGRELSLNGGVVGGFVDAVTNGKYYGDQMQALLEGDIKEATDDLATFNSKQQTVEGIIADIKADADPYVTQAEKYRESVNSAKLRYDELLRGAQALYKDFQTQGELDLYNKAVKGVNDYYNNTYKPRSDTYNDYINSNNYKTYVTDAYAAAQATADNLQREWDNTYSKVADNLNNKLIPQFDALNDKYQDAQVTITQLSDDVGKYTNSIMETFTKSAVEIATDGMFVPEQYRDMLVATNMVSETDARNLTEADLYNHYLEAGQYAELPINTKDYRTKLNEAAAAIVYQQVALSGLKSNEVDPASVQALYEEVVNTALTADANGSIVALENLRTSSINDFNWINDVTVKDEYADKYFRSDAGDYVNIEGEIPKAVPNVTYDTSRVTLEDINSGNVAYIPSKFNELGQITERTVVLNQEANITEIVNALKEGGVDINVNDFFATNDGALEVTVYAYREDDLVDFSELAANGLEQIGAAEFYDIAVAGINANLNTASKYANYAWEDLGVGDLTADAVVAMASAAVSVAEKTGNQEIVNATATIVGKSLPSVIGFFGSALDIAADVETPRAAEVIASLEDLYTASTPEELEARVKAFTENAGQGHNLLKSIISLGEEVWKDPYAATYAALGELGEEILTLGTSKLVRGTKLIGAGLDTNGKRIVDAISKRAEVSTAVGLELVEAYGGAGQEAYDTVFMEAKAAGLSEDEADQVARDAGHRVGLIGMMTSLATTNGKADLGVTIKQLGMVDNATNRALLTNMVDYTTNMTKVFGREAVQEWGDEAITAAAIEFEAVQYNPDRDIVGNILQAGALGAFLGGTSGVAMTGITDASSYVRDALKNNSYVSGLAERAATGDTAAKQELITTLNNAFDGAESVGPVPLTGELLAADAMSQYDDTIAGVDDIIDMMRDPATGVFEAVDGQSGYEFSYEDMSKLLTQTVGTNVEDARGVVATYADERYMDVDEVRRAAAQEGVYLTQDQAVALTAQGTTEAELVTQLREQYNPYGVTRQEIIDRYAELGYTPTEAELNKYAPADVSTIPSGQTVLDASLGRMGEAGRTDPLYDVNGDGKVNIADAIKALRFQTGLDDPYETASYSFLEANNLIGQPSAPADNQSEIFNAIEAYIDPRQVTLEEAREFVANNPEFAGFEISDADLTEMFVGQGGRNFERNAVTDLNQYIDQNSTSPEEVRAYYETEGYNIPEGYSFDHLAGQYPDAELPEMTDSESATAYNMLNYSLEKYVAEGYARDEAILAAVNDVAAELSMTKTDLLNAIGETEASLLNKLSDVETGLGEQITDVETGLGKQIADVETGLGEQITDTQAALEADINAVADMLGVPPQTVTQQELDYVTQWVAQNIETPTDYQLGYDLDGDGQITQTDLDIMSISGMTPNVLAEVAPESRFGKRGTAVDYATQIALDQQYALEQAQQQNLEQQQQMEQNLQQQMEQNLQQQLEQQQQLATETQRMGNLGDLMGMLMQAPDAAGQTVSVRTPDPARINYIYDFDSIFANPQQGAMFPSPYKKGGKVGDDDDEFYKLIGA